MTRYASVLELPPGMREQAERQLAGDGHVNGKVPGSNPPAPAGPKPAPPPNPPNNPRKYRNEPVVIDGERYDSKLEYLCHEALKRRRELGEIGPVILRQINFVLEGGVKYRADFVVNPIVYPFIEIIDAKGCDTRGSINKRKQVHARYGVEVRLWKRSAT